MEKFSKLKNAMKRFGGMNFYFIIVYGGNYDKTLFNKSTINLLNSSICELMLILDFNWRRNNLFNRYN